MDVAVASSSDRGHMHTINALASASVHQRCDCDGGRIGGPPNDVDVDVGGQSMARRRRRRPATAVPYRHEEGKPKPLD